MAIAYVRDTGHKTGNGVSSSTGSFASLPAAGNTVVVFISCFDGGSVTFPSGGVTDNQSNTYSQDVVSFSSKPTTANIFADIDIGSPSGTFTITVTPNGSTWFEWIAVEFSGLADASVLDKTAAASGISTAPTATTPTTTQNDELIAGLVSITDTSATAIGMDFPAGYTQLGTIVQDPFNTIAHMAGYKIVSATGTQNYNGGTLARTVNAGRSWEVAVATYKMAAAAAAAYPWSYYQQQWAQH